MHDEVILPTMVSCIWLVRSVPVDLSILQCFWAPRILDWDRKHSSKPQLWAAKEDIEDTIDIGGNAITAAMRKSVQHLTQPRLNSSNGLAAPDSGNQATEGDPSPSVPAIASSDTMIAEAGLIVPVGTALDVKPTVEAPRASSPAVSASNSGTSKSFLGSQQPSKKGGTPTPVEPAALPLTSVDHALESSKLPLDVAVYESITQAGGDDKVKRVITNILITGGTANMQGVGFALQSRYASHKHCFYA